MWIEAISGGGVTPTPITPSDATPAQMVSGTTYKPTASGYAISSYSNTTPSNSSPVSLASGTVHKINGNGGYGIASYYSVTPSSTPYSISSGNFYKAGGSGVIVDAVTPAPTSITPSNSNPVALTANTSVKPTASGYAIASYSNVTPSNSSPVALTSGNISKMGGNGYAIQSYTDVTPSNSSPVALTSGNINKMGGNGYAVQSYSSVTPSASGAYFSSGIIKMSSSGYAYSSQPSGGDYTLFTNDDSATTTKTISSSSSLAGRTFLVLIYMSSGSTQLAYNRYDNTTFSGGSATKITNLMSSNNYVTGTFFKLTVSGNSCGVTHSNNFRMVVFG